MADNAQEEGSSIPTAMSNYWLPSSGRPTNGFRFLVIRCFQAQKVRFRFHPSSETGEVTRRAHDSVAWNNNRNWISTVCPSHSSTGCGISKSLCDVAVSACFGKRNTQQNLPHLLLKRGTTHVQR